jgi:hypothetical protein
MGTKDARRSVSASGARVVRPWVPCGSTVAGLPVVSETTRAPVPAAWVAADYRYLRSPKFRRVGADVPAVGRAGPSMTGEGTAKWTE